MTQDIETSEVRIRVHDVRAAACRHFGLQTVAMVSPRRERQWVYARQIAMTVAHAITGASLVQIGQTFGNRDHTTVIHAIRAINERCRKSPQANADFEAVEDLAKRIANRETMFVPAERATPAERVEDRGIVFKREIEESAPSKTSKPAPQAEARSPASYEYGFPWSWWLENDQRFKDAMADYRKQIAAERGIAA